MKFSPGTGGFVSPDKVLAQLGVKEGWQVADFGCGHGYFALPLSRLVGSSGKVFAIDILSETLDAVRSRAQIENVTNIKGFRGNLEVPRGSGLADGQVDMVLTHNILFQSQKKDEIIKEAKRVLKSAGFLTLIDWLPLVQGSEAFGPAGGWRLSPQEARQLAEDNGFVLARSLDLGQYHFGLMFKKL